MKNGHEAITTTTHAFVKLATTSSALRLRVAEWYPSIRDALVSLIPLRRTPDTPAIGETRQRGANSSLGTAVGLAGTDRKVGTITATYDPHPIPIFLPFPAGFRHDLSLITDENLPRLTSPPKTPVITGWGSYAAALDGGPLFVSCLNVITGRGGSASGQGTSRAAQTAIAAGSEYSWTRHAVSANIALLWRSEYDPDCVRGYSGSVLCLGKVTDPTASALVFQNFQVPVRSDHVVNDHRDKLFGTHRHVLKAGFLLPEEIRESTILTTSPPIPIDPNSLDPAKRASTDDQRRIVSGP